MVLGLLADPELPAGLAEQLAGGLPELPAERLDDGVCWQSQVQFQRFDLADEDRLLAGMVRANGPWRPLTGLSGSLAAAYGYRQQERRDPVPQSSAAPAMLLVMAIKGTLAPDGTISNEVTRTYLVCRSRGAVRAVQPQGD